jgi:GH18 family chitinase
MFIRTATTNYAHNNQSIGQWAETKEFIAIAVRYHREAFADAKLLRGRGFDFDTLEDDLNYGGNIYKDYDEKEL